MSQAEQLISGYFDATLTDDEVAELEALLLADKETASLFARTGDRAQRDPGHG